MRIKGGGEIHADEANLSKESFKTGNQCILPQIRDTDS